MKRKILNLALCLSLVVTSLASNPITAFAEENLAEEESLKNQINEVIYLFKEVYDYKYEGIKSEIEELIVKEDFDYYLSMDTFYNQDSPLKKADCIRYLAAYMSAKDYAAKHNLKIPAFKDIPFISYKYEVKEAKEYLPTKVPNYVPDETVKGEYWLAGEKYIVDVTEVMEYTQLENGRFKQTGESFTVTPDIKELKYMDITLSVIEPTDIFAILGIDETLVKKDYERRIVRLESATTNAAIKETLYKRISLENPIIPQDLSQYDYLLENLSDDRKAVVATALSLVGQVPYEWGGKPRKAGVDEAWWQYNPDNGLQRGLDCSGFVQWVYLTAGFEPSLINMLTSTTSMLDSNIKRIEKQELTPGCIGVTNRLKGEINHCGIYLGNDLWIHCSSTKETVVISKTYYNTFLDPIGSL